MYTDSSNGFQFILKLSFQKLLEEGTAHPAETSTKPSPPFQRPRISALSPLWDGEARHLPSPPHTHSGSLAAAVTWGGAGEGAEKFVL